MPIVILIIGIILIFSGINNKLGELKGLVNESLSPKDGSASFPTWIVAIILVGALGYSKTLKPLSNALLALVIAALILAHGGFLDKFISAMKGK